MFYILTARYKVNIEEKISQNQSHVGFILIEIQRTMSTKGSGQFEIIIEAAETMKSNPTRVIIKYHHF